MSWKHVLEPPTKGKVIIDTTHGPIDIELWPKEAPKSVRNFVQLCLEGYLDNTIFHRVIPGFLVQGGDPTGSGTGGESIYGGVFGDEFDSRLRFNNRGIVAMANERAHLILMEVTGNSIYNLLRLGEVDTSKDDRPLDPAPKILSVEVLWNPFEDIVPRVLSKASQPVVEVKEPPRKPVKKLNLLSFGEEAEEEDKKLAAVKQKIKSIHDDDDESKFDAKMSSQVLNRRKEMGDTPSKPPPTQKKSNY